MKIFLIAPYRFEGAETADNINLQSIISEGTGGYRGACDFHNTPIKMTKVETHINPIDHLADQSQKNIKY